MYWKVKSVSPLDNYMLLLTFEDGEQRHFDVKPYLDFGVFRALKSNRRFNTVKVYADTIAWDGEIDLDPEFLYAHSTKI
ncbi:hypothetical protein FACS189467_1000 [Bacteroidia bacterium]|nr:hypothetical protein FACS189467_1000 [Bacteroidia bacterium]